MDSSLLGTALVLGLAKVPWNVSVHTQVSILFSGFDVSTDFSLIEHTCT